MNHRHFRNKPQAQYFERDRRNVENSGHTSHRHDRNHVLDQYIRPEHHEHLNIGESMCGDNYDLSPDRLCDDDFQDRSPNRRDYSPDRTDHHRYDKETSPARHRFSPRMNSFEHYRQESRSSYDHDHDQNYRSQDQFYDCHDSGSPERYSQPSRSSERHDDSFIQSRERNDISPRAWSPEPWDSRSERRSTERFENGRRVDSPGRFSECQDFRGSRSPQQFSNRQNNRNSRLRDNLRNYQRNSPGRESRVRDRSLERDFWDDQHEDVWNNENNNVRSRDGYRRKQDLNTHERRYNNDNNSQHSFHREDEHDDIRYINDNDSRHSSYRNRGSDEIRYNEDVDSRHSFQRHEIDEDIESRHSFDREFCVTDEIGFSDDKKHAYDSEDNQDRNSQISFVSCDDLSSGNRSPEINYRDDDRIDNSMRNQLSDKAYRNDTRLRSDRSRSRLSDRSRSELSDRSRSRLSDRSRHRVRPDDNLKVSNSPVRIRTDSPSRLNRSRSPHSVRSRDSQNKGDSYRNSRGNRDLKHEKDTISCNRREDSRDKTSRRKRGDNRSKSPRDRSDHRHGTSSPNRRRDDRRKGSHDRSVISKERTTKYHSEQSKSRFSKERENKVGSDEENIRSPIDEVGDRSGALSPSFLNSMPMVKTVGLGFQTAKWEMMAADPLLNTILTQPRVPDIKESPMPLPSNPQISAPVQQEMISPPNNQTFNKNIHPYPQINAMQNVRPQLGNFGPRPQNFGLRPHNFRPHSQNFLQRPPNRGTFPQNMPPNTHIKTSQSFVFGKPPCSVHGPQNMTSNVQVRPAMTQSFVYGRPPNIQQVAQHIRPAFNMNTMRPQAPKITIEKPPVPYVNTVKPQGSTASHISVSQAAIVSQSTNSSVAKVTAGTNSSVAVSVGKTSIQPTATKQSPNKDHSKRQKPLPVRFVVKTLSSDQKSAIGNVPIEANKSDTSSIKTGNKKMVDSVTNSDNSRNNRNQMKPSVTDDSSVKNVTKTPSKTEEQQKSSEKSNNSASRRNQAKVSMFSSENSSVKNLNASKQNLSESAEQHNSTANRTNQVKPSSFSVEHSSDKNFNASIQNLTKSVKQQNSTTTRRNQAKTSRFNVEDSSVKNLNVSKQNLTKPTKQQNSTAMSNSACRSDQAKKSTLNALENKTQNQTRLEKQKNIQSSDRCPFDFDKRIGDSKDICGKEKPPKAGELKTRNADKQKLYNPSKVTEHIQSDTLSDFTNEFILQCKGKQLSSSDHYHEDPTSDMANQFILDCKTKTIFGREEISMDMNKDSSWKQKLSGSARKSLESRHVKSDEKSYMYSPSRPNDEEDDLSIVDINNPEGLRITVSNHGIQRTKGSTVMSSGDKEATKIVNPKEDLEEGEIDGEEVVPMDEESSITCRIKRPSTCPIPECQFIAWRLKRHAFAKHIPWLFREGKWCENIPSCGAAIRQLVIWIVGAHGKPDELVKLINESELMPTNIHINSNDFVHMKQLCIDQNWPVEETFTLNPVNSPACLVNWRALLLLLIYISEPRREKFKEMFNSSFVESKNAEELKKRNQPSKKTAPKRTKDDTQKSEKPPDAKRSRTTELENRRNRGRRSRSPAYGSSNRSTRDCERRRPRNRSPNSTYGSDIRADRTSDFQKESASIKGVQPDNKRSVISHFPGQNEQKKSMQSLTQDSFTSPQLQQLMPNLSQSTGSLFSQNISSGQRQFTNQFDQQKRPTQDKQVSLSKNTLDQQMKILDQSMRGSFDVPPHSSASQIAKSDKPPVTIYDKRRRRSPVNEQKKSTCDKLVKSIIDQNKRSALVQSMRSFLNKPLESEIKEQQKKSSQIAQSRLDTFKSKPLPKQETSGSSLEASMMKTLEELRKSALPESMRSKLEASMRDTLNQLNKTNKLEELNQVEETMLSSLERMKEGSIKETSGMTQDDVKRVELENSMKSTLEHFCSLLDASSAKMSKKQTYPLDSVSSNYSETLYSRKESYKADELNRQSNNQTTLQASPMKKTDSIVEYAATPSDDEESVIEITDSPSPPPQTSPILWGSGDVKRKTIKDLSFDHDMKNRTGDNTSASTEVPYVRDWNHKSPWVHLREKLSALSDQVPQEKGNSSHLLRVHPPKSELSESQSKKEMWDAVHKSKPLLLYREEDTSKWKILGTELKGRPRSSVGAPQGYGPPQGGGYGPPQPGYPGAPPPQQMYGGGGFSGPPPGIDPNVYQWFMTVDQDKSGHITAHELQQALVNGNWSHFNPETCRLMINMFDRDNTGTIQLNEFQALWNYIQQWKGVFERFDGNRSGSIEAHELQQAYQQMGYNLSPQFCAVVIAKFDAYGRRSLTLDNFIQSCVMLKSLTDSFKQRDPQMQGSIRMAYEDFMTTAVFNKI